MRLNHQCTFSHNPEWMMKSNAFAYAKYVLLYIHTYIHTNIQDLLRRFSFKKTEDLKMIKKRPGQ